MSAPDPARTTFVGLTGGMGAGKSTALELLGQLGARTTSSDRAVHDLLGTDEVRDLLRAELGEAVLDSQGRLDRGAVAREAFASEQRTAWLEGVMWPRVRERVSQWRLALAPGTELAVVEVPLLFESGGEDAYDRTIAVVADDDLRADRVGERGHQALAQRERRQLAQEEKSLRADFTVRNDGTVAELKAQLSEVLETIRSEV